MPYQQKQKLTRLSIQYFLYFAVLGVFLPYFNLYCYHIGFSAFQIGLLSSLRSMVMTLMPIAWSVLADRFLGRKPIYVFCNVSATLSWVLFLYTDTFYPMLAATVLYGFFFAPIISFLEAFSIDTLGSDKKSYGSLRVWGSLSFIVVVAVLGRSLDRMPMSSILWLILLGSAVQTLASTLVPKTDDHPSASFLEGVRLMIDFRIIGFLLSGFLMLVSHGAYYGFFSIRMESIGFSKSMIGISWAVASISEIPMMLSSGRLFKRFSPESVLVLSFLTAVLRWILLAVLSSPWLLLFSQVLHAITYAAFHMSSILYMDRLTPPGLKTVGQSMNNALTYGLGFMIGFLMSGWLFEAMGARFMFLVSAGIAFLGCVLFIQVLRFQRSNCFF